MNNLLKSIFLFFGISLFITSIFSCKKETITFTETVTVVDTLVINNIDTIFQVDTINLPMIINDTATTFILFKHAEKGSSGSNPSLTVTGMARAQELKRVLENIDIAQVFSSNYNRTKQTAQPTALDHDLTLNIYDAFNLPALASEVMAEYQGQTVVISGHSDTTPDLINILLGENIIEEIDENEFDNLFIVTVFEIGRAEVLHLKYGE